MTPNSPAVQPRKRRRPIRSSFESWVGNPAYDIIGIAIAFAVITWMQRYYGWRSGAAAFSTTVAVLSATAVGFAVTAATILLTVTPGKRLGKIVENAGDRLIALIMISASTLIVLAAFFAYSLLGTEPNRIEISIIGSAGALSALVQLRLVSLFYQIFALLIAEQTKENDKQTKESDSNLT